MQSDPETRQMPEKLHQTVIALRGHFIDDLERRILEVEAALNDIRSGTNRMTAAQKVVTAAHNLAGLAPSLGFDDIGDAAAKSEHLWEQAITAQLSQETVTPALAMIETLLDLMEDALNH